MQAFHVCFLFEYNEYNEPPLLNTNLCCLTVSSFSGFWKDSLDLTEGDETVVFQSEPLISNDRMSLRALDDMKRALGVQNVRRPACAPERLLRYVHLWHDLVDCLMFQSPVAELC